MKVAHVYVVGSILNQYNNFRNQLERPSETIVYIFIHLGQVIPNLEFYLNEIIQNKENNFATTIIV